MSDDENEGVPAQNHGHFTGNSMNLKLLKFNARQENQLEALKALKIKCGYIFK